MVARIITCWSRVALFDALVEAYASTRKGMAKTNFAHGVYSVIRARLRSEHDQVFDQTKASVERGGHGDDGLHRTIYISLTVRRANQIERKIFATRVLY